LNSDNFDSSSSDNDSDEEADGMEVNLEDDEKEDVTLGGMKLLRDGNHLYVRPNQSSLLWKFATLRDVTDCTFDIDPTNVSWTEFKIDNRGDKPKISPTITGKDLRLDPGLRREFDYFKVFWPMEFMKKVCKYTSQRLGAHQKVPTVPEIMKFLGLVLLMRRANPNMSRKELWSKGDDFEPSFHLAKHGMTLARFNQIAANLAFVDIATQQDKEKERQAIIEAENAEDANENVFEVEDFENPDNADDDPEKDLHEERPPIVPSLWAIKELVEAFNECREKNICPSGCACADESTIKWFGKDFRHTDGCPVVKKMKGKPCPVCIELKGLVCGEAAIMLVVLPSGNKYNKIEDQFSHYPTHVATTLRLANRLKGTGRSIFADSWFGSVHCATALYQELGLHSTMVVKRNHKNYPKEHFRQLFEDIKGARPTGESLRGQVKFATSAHTLDPESEKVPLFATCWREHKELNYIGTCGSSLSGQPRKIQLWKNTATKSVPFYWNVKRPMNIKEYSDHAGKQDVHNHYRQGILALEGAFRTRRWELRTFVSLFDMAVTDAYLAFRHFGHYLARTPSFEKFIKGMAQWLIKGDPETDEDEVEDVNEDDRIVSDSGNPFNSGTGLLHRCE